MFDFYAKHLRQISYKFLIRSNLVIEKNFLKFNSFYSSYKEDLSFFLTVEIEDIENNNFNLEIKLIDLDGDSLFEISNYDSIINISSVISNSIEQAFKIIFDYIIGAHNTVPFYILEHIDNYLKQVKHPFTRKTITEESLSFPSKDSFENTIYYLYYPKYEDFKGDYYTANFTKKAKYVQLEFCYYYLQFSKQHVHKMLKILLPIEVSEDVLWPVKRFIDETQLLI